MTLEVTDDTFFLVQIPEGKTIHDNEDGAIKYLRQRADNVNPEEDEVAVVRVSVDGEDWTIAEMSWQNIALKLMGDE